MLQFWARPTCILDVMRRHGQMLQFWARPTCILDVMRKHGQMLQFWVRPTCTLDAKVYHDDALMDRCFNSGLGPLNAFQWTMVCQRLVVSRFHGRLPPASSNPYQRCNCWTAQSKTVVSMVVSWTTISFAWEIPVDDQSLVELPYHVKSFAMMHLISLPVPPLWASGATG